MPSTRDIRRRIKSVKNTRQITRAMELVASSKMKKAQQAAISGRPYASLLVSMIANIAPHFEEGESLHPFIDKREIKTRGILLITTDKGLCGPSTPTSSSSSPTTFRAPHPRSLSPSDARARNTSPG
ncbi:F0F1 ATP synthase subunit gamma [Ereboglobus luteus]|uniref:F0F1 ATP synthase subunit gamma n=1 Tax=Ereboglobus luteus TaxID=1796921 RepID=UPI00202B10CE|nr:F0F1 ATP synthase subunit gamma [Ereboglobus luteus]